jgi:hypothetical protein
LRLCAFAGEILLAKAAFVQSLTAIRFSRAFVIYRFRSRLRASDMKAATWIKRLGFWGFLFFLVKGLLWLIIPALAVYLAN